MNLHPTKKVTKKEYRFKFKPWKSTEILNLINQRDELLQRFSREKDPDYKQLRNLVTQKKQESKSIYNITYFEQIREKSSQIWKGIRILVKII